MATEAPVDPDLTKADNRTRKKCMASLEFRGGGGREYRVRPALIRSNTLHRTGL